MDKFQDISNNIDALKSKLEAMRNTQTSLSKVSSIPMESIDTKLSILETPLDDKYKCTVEAIDRMAEAAANKYLAEKERAKIDAQVLEQQLAIKKLEEQRVVIINELVDSVNKLVESSNNTSILTEVIHVLNKQTLVLKELIVVINTTMSTLIKLTKDAEQVRLLEKLLHNITSYSTSLNITTPVSTHITGDITSKNDVNIRTDTN